jgi:rod shape-determining protein MreD
MIPITIGFIVVAYVIAVIDGTVAGLVSIGPARPDFVVLAALSFGLYLRSDVAPVFLGFAMGLVGDCFRPASLGLGAFVGAFVGFVAVSYRQRLSLEGPVFRAASVVPIAFAAAVVSLLSSPAGGPAGFAWLIATSALPGSVYTAVLALGLFAVLGRPRYGAQVR